MMGQGFPGGQVRRVPSEEERREVERINGMQVRTQAASLACAMLQHRQTSTAVWGRWAREIERYITEGRISGDPAPSVLPRAQAG